MQSFLKLPGDSKIKQGLRTIALKPTSRAIIILELYNLVGMHYRVVFMNVITNKNIVMMNINQPISRM